MLSKIKVELKRWDLYRDRAARGHPLRDDILWSRVFIFVGFKVELGREDAP